MEKIEGEELKAIVSGASQINASYMMATKAYHYMGDISREEPDLCYIYKETEDYYVGNWITGYGFINVLLPKETTRELTPEEIENYNNTYVQIGSQPPFKLQIDDGKKR